MKFRCRLAVVVLTLLASAVAMSANAVGELFDYTTGIRGTRMWVPPGLQTVKGIVIYGNGAEEDYRGAADAPWLQKFAQLHDFALIATSFWGNLSGSEITTWDSHLQALATMSAHAELVHAPWAPIGFSNGGQMSYGFNALRPEKTIAFVTNKGCCYNNRTPPTASLRTPGILIAGELDTATRNDSIRTLFETNRARGALWSWVVQPGVGHSFDGLATELLLPFMAEAIRLRYPDGQAPTATSGVTLLPVNESAGWLVDQTTWKSGLTKISAYDEYVGSKQTAGWLLNENVAAVYRAFSTYDRPVRLGFNEPGANPFETGVRSGDHAPATLRLNLDVSALLGWSKLELLNYATPVLSLAPGDATGTIVPFDAPLPRPGTYAFSVLVTHADGMTISTSNPVTYTVVPEPSASSALLIGIVVSRVRCRQRKSQILIGT